MDIRKATCAAAAGFITLTLVGAAIHPAQAAPRGEVVVSAYRVDTALQRVVSYADLNLRARDDQRILGRRIEGAANSICKSVNTDHDSQSMCFTFAAREVKPQVMRAIERAEMIAEGKAVGPPVAISLSIIGN